MRLLLVNPNTNAATTETMRRIAARAAPAGVDVEGLTVTRGAALITDPEALARAAEAVAEAEVAIRARAPDAVIVAAFGDPGRAALAERLAVPVIGIGEAGMRAGAAGGRRFAVVTTTPALVGSITAMAERLGLAKQFAGVELTEGDAATVTGDPMLLPGALEAASRRAIAEGDVAALVIGGGPLAEAARGLAFAGIEIVEPVPAAVARAIAATGI
jgi:Asp/Glu/hydantoin racemase